MAKFKEYSTFDGLGLAELVAKGDVSPRELVDTAFDAIDRLNPKLNAIINRMEDHAEAVLREGPANGPFRGVPFVAKDLLISYAGIPTSGASRLTEGYTRNYDSELVKRFKSSGVITIGKSNTPELGLNASAEPILNGPTRNPWNLDHTTGGSSGGSAAAVASGIVPMGHANDGGGSTRIPATCCHLVGLKQTRGRNPAGPDNGEIWTGLVCEHIVSRTIRDTAAMLDCTSGYSVGDPYYAPPPERPFLKEVGRDPGKLRIAFSTTGPLNEPVDDECRSALLRTARVLEDLGHNVEEAAPTYDASAFSDAFVTIQTAHCAMFMEDAAKLMDRELSGDTLERINHWVLEEGRKRSALDMCRAVGQLNQTCRQVGPFFETYNVFMTPGAAAPPVPLGYLNAEGDPDEVWDRMRTWSPFTHIYNGTGQPAMSVPASISDDGFPLGIQIVARYGEDGLLICLGSQLEEAQPWKHDRPPIYA